jgi:hypothetical protein
MTISADTPFEVYNIVDTNAPLNFGHPFEFNDELEVRENGVMLDIGTDYSVTGAGAPAGGSVNPVNATVSSTWTVQRISRLAQLSTPSDPVVGYALDRLTKQSQDVRVDADRSIKLHLTDSTFDTELPVAVPGMALVVNATGDGFEFQDADDAITSRVADLETGLAQETADRIDAVAAETAARIAQDNALLALITGGGSSPEDVKLFLSLDQVNNTSDVNKPVSTAQAAAIAAGDALKLGLHATADNSALLGGQNLAYVLALANATGVIPDASLPAQLRQYLATATNANTGLPTLNGWCVLLPGAGNNGPNTVNYWSILTQSFTTGSTHIRQTAWALDINQAVADSYTWEREFHGAAWTAWYHTHHTETELNNKYSQWFIQAGDPGAVGAGAIWVTP